MAYTYTIDHTMANVNVTNAGAVLWIAKSTAQGWMHSDAIPTSIRVRGTVSKFTNGPDMIFSIKNSGYSLLASKKFTVSSLPVAIDQSFSLGSSAALQKYNWDNTMAIVLEVPYTTSAQVTMTGITVSITYTSDMAPASDFSVGNVNLGASSTVTITPATSSVSHKVIWSIGSYSQTNTVAAGTKTSSYTIPASWGGAFPAANTGTMTVKVETYQGSTKTGEKSKTVTLTCPSYTPSASISAAVVDAVSGAYKQYVSKCKLTASGSSSYGATIKAYAISGHGISVSASSGTTSVLTKQGSLTYTVTVTDTRNKTKSATVTISVTAAGAATITAGNVTAGASSSVTIQHTYNSNLYHKVTWSIGSKTYTATTAKAATSSAYTIPADWSGQIPNATTGALKITVVSYDADNKAVGTATKNVTMTCAAYTISASLAASVVDPVNNTYGQYKSKCKLTATASSSYGATIKSYSITGHGINVSASSGTTSVLTQSGSLTYSLTVTDSRGKTRTVTTSITVATCGASTVVVANVTAGNASAVTISHTYNSHLHHTVTWSIGSNTYTVNVAKAGTSASYTIPTSWANSVPNAMSGSLTVTVKSYDENNALTGTTTKTITMSVPAYDVSASLAAEQVDGHWNLYVQRVSKCKLTCTASTSYGATISTYTWSNVSGSTAVVTTPVLTESGSRTYSVTVKDSRGKTATATVTITVTAYNKPVLTLAEAVRCDSSGTPLRNGTTGLLSLRFTWSAIGSNEIHNKVEFAQQATTPSWETIFTDLATNSETIFKQGLIARDHTYLVRLTLWDSLQSPIETILVINPGATYMYWGKDRIGFFAYPEHPGVEVSSSKDFYTHGTEIIDLIMPVGIQITYTGSTALATVYPGTTWSSLGNNVYKRTA